MLAALVCLASRRKRLAEWDLETGDLREGDIEDLYRAG